MGNYKFPSLQELGEKFNLAIIGDPQKIINGLAPLESAVDGQLAFLVNPLYRKDALSSKASCIILNQLDFDYLSKNTNGDQLSFLISKNPYASFARIAQFFETINKTPIKASFHPSSFIDPSAVVPDSCHVGPFCFVGAGVVLGERVTLVSHISIGNNVKIGSDSVLNSNSTIYKDCAIGDRAIIHSGAVIGADGFGFAPDFTSTSSEWVKIPQSGRVVIGNDIEIGANTTIDRGAMDDTLIGDGCKIDNQVQIAHNVRIGSFTVIAGCAAIAGSTTVGKLCVIGGSANLAGHLSIADRTTVSGGTSITRSIKEPGQHFTSVFPFTTHIEWEKNAAIVRGIDKLRKRIQALEKNQKEDK
jgi:UDP-3-O-[3-hydroxymyristoyl] glucosamine N-acyltransferase